MRLFFEEMIGRMGNPLVIFLDSIDQLSPDNESYEMAWLPKQLPANVKIVISTLPDVKYQILQHLQVFSLFSSGSVSCSTVSQF